MGQMLAFAGVDLTVLNVIFWRSRAPASTARNPVHSVWFHRNPKPSQLVRTERCRPAFALLQDGRQANRMSPAFQAEV